MEDILEIINSISTISFLDKFQLVRDNDRRFLPEYRAQLHEWNLVSEIELIDNNYAITQKIGNDNRLIRIYNNTAFDSKGNYNTNRYSILKELI